MSFLDPNQILESRPKIALIGATDNTRKYGNIILRDLKQRRFSIYPVNPTKEEIEGLKTHANLTELVKEIRPELLVYVVPPERTLESLEEAAGLGLKTVWIQPGAGDDRVQAFLEKNGFDYIMNACVMVQGPR